MACAEFRSAEYRCRGGRLGLWSGGHCGRAGTVVGWVGASRMPDGSASLAEVMSGMALLRRPVLLGLPDDAIPGGYPIGGRWRAGWSGR